MQIVKQAAARTVDAIRNWRPAECSNLDPLFSVQTGMEWTISSPCPKRWKDLVGNDRVRYCGDCKLNVYNLTVMKPAEIEALVRRTSGRLCGQLFVRDDRKATLRDCPAGRAGVLRRRLWKIASAFLVLALGLAFRGMDRPDTSSLPLWLRAVADLVDSEKPRPRVMRTVGEISCVPVTPISPPAPTRSVPKAGP